MHKEVIKRTLLLADYDTYAGYNTVRNIPLLIRVNSTYSVEERVSLAEAILQVISAVFMVCNANVTELSEDNADISFLLTNGGNSILTALLNSALLYMNVGMVIPIVCRNLPCT